MVIDKGRAIEYLAAELYGILKANVEEQIWLNEVNGEIQHGYNKLNEDSIGGERPPFMATQDGYIFEPKVPEVIGFLNSFNLDQREAEQVLQLVKRQRQIEYSRQQQQNS